MPRNKHFIIQDYLKLFIPIQCYRVFPRFFPRQYYLKLYIIIQAHKKGSNKILP